MRYLLIFLLFSFGFHSLAIGQVTNFHGAVMDYESGKRIEGVEVINLDSKESIHTNGMGIFTIKGEEGDTLSFNAPDYNLEQIVLHGASDIIIRLKPSFQLREVNVYGESKKDQLDDVMNDFRKKGNYYTGKPPPLAYVFTPISALYGLLGKTPKNARRFQKYMSFELEQSLVDRKFTINLVQSVTGLSDDDLVNYMDIYRPPFHLIEHWNEYDVRSYIKKSFDIFESNGRPPAPKLPKIEIPKQER